MRRYVFLVSAWNPSFEQLWLAAAGVYSPSFISYRVPLCTDSQPLPPVREMILPPSGDLPLLTWSCCPAVYVNPTLSLCIYSFITCQTQQSTPKLLPEPGQSRWFPLLLHPLHAHHFSPHIGNVAFLCITCWDRNQALAVLRCLVLTLMPGTRGLSKCWNEWMNIRTAIVSSHRSLLDVSDACSLPYITGLLLVHLALFTGNCDCSQEVFVLSASD